MKSNRPIRYIFDTDAVTWHQRNDPQIINRLAQLNPETVGVTVVTMYEQLRGRLAAINRKQSDEQAERAFRLFAMTQNYYCYLPVLPFDEDATRIYNQLVTRKIRIGTQDLRIASITLAHKATLITSNNRHFSQVPNLKIEDWRR